MQKSMIFNKMSLNSAFIDILNGCQPKGNSGLENIKRPNLH